MKFTAQIANFGVEDLQGEILTSGVTIKRELPVTLDFQGPVVGFAKAKKTKTGIVATIELFEHNIDLRLAHLFNAVVGGSITKRRGKRITKYRVDSVSLTTTPCDPTLPKLKEIK